MKRPSALFICGAVAFTLIAVGYLIGYISLSEQAHKIADLESQNQSFLTNQRGLYKNLATLDGALEGLKTANRREMKEMLSKIDGITGKIQSWKEEYNAFLNNIKEGIDNLAKVDLGKVEVEKRNE